MKVGRNSPCPCLSGKKYKHCCLNQTIPPIKLLPITAYVSTTGNEPCRMKVSNISYTDSLGNSLNLNKEFEVSVNQVTQEGQINKSASKLEIPIYKEKNPQIYLENNAKVETKQNLDEIPFVLPKKKIKHKKDDLFVIIKTQEQRDEGYYYLDIFYGKISNGAEHAHILIRPDGNSKHLGYRNFSTEINIKNTYNSEDDVNLLNEILITLIDFNQNLKIEFEFNQIEKKLVYMRSIIQDKPI